MYIHIQEFDNQGKVKGVTSIRLDDVHTITATTKDTGSGKKQREFTLHRKSGVSYPLTLGTTLVVDAPGEFHEWLRLISRNLSA